MTRKISADLWKVVVFELITTYTFSLSSWVIFEWFTQKLFPCDNRTLSPFFGLKIRFLSFWVGGLPYKYIHSVSQILIRGYSKTQKRPFYSIYIYIYYIYIYIRYLENRITTRILWVNYSKTLKKLKGIALWRKNRATDLCPIIIRAQSLCDLSLKNDGKKLIQLEDYGVQIIIV